MIAAASLALQKQASSLGSLVSKSRGAHALFASDELPQESDAVQLLLLLLLPAT